MKQVHLAVNGWTGTAHYHVQIVDPQHGSALEAWKAMGSPAFPTPQQYEQLRQVALGTQTLDAPSFSLPAHGLAVVEVAAR
jgi:xylan 1,4-beta-xylosidase